MSQSNIFSELDDFLEYHLAEYGMTFSLEYSSVIDWVAAFCPSKNHPTARQYEKPPAVCAHVLREDAIQRALNQARELFGDERT